MLVIKASVSTDENVMDKVLKNSPTVDETAARLASRRGERAKQSPQSRRPSQPMPAHALPPPTGPPVMGLSTYEAARVAGICRSLLYREIATGRLIAHKFHRRTVILHSDLADWLAALPRMPASQLAPSNSNREEAPAQSI
jgi:hypothetical protein